MKTTYEQMGGEPGIRAPVERFYALMDTLPEAATIRAMHPADLSESIEKLVLFLIGFHFYRLIIGHVLTCQRLCSSSATRRLCHRHLNSAPEFLYISTQEFSGG